jgi:glutamyl-tRNA synthetase
MTRVRFAPTPSGHLFLAAARVALANDLFIRHRGGRMLLRIDDLEKQQPIDPILQDLAWLGIKWNDSFRQSERMDLYNQTIEQLKRDKFIYPCFESEEELRAKAEFRRKRHQSVQYDRAMLRLTEKQRESAEAGGKQPHWRFKLSGRTMEWHDMVLGRREATLSHVSDPILVKADGTPTPILASVIDDLDFGTTHIIRGEDNAGNTAIQMELFEVLGLRKPIRFAHLPALGDKTPSDKASGRKPGGMSVRGLRGDGMEPCAVTAALAGLGPEDGDPPPLDELAKRFELSALSAQRFEVPRMLAVNRSVLGHLGFQAVAERLPNGATEAFWLAIRGSLDLLREARGWWDVVAGTIVPPVIDDAHDVLTAAQDLLPPEPWDHAVWNTWITALEAATSRSAEALLAPLRLALTGEDEGPDLADLLPLIGRPRAAARLAIAAA